MSLHWHGAGQGQPGHNPMMRASDSDRERAADVLKAGYSEGRLSKEEYDHRLDRVHRAATYADIQPMIVDLPQGPVPMTGYQQQPMAVVPQAFRPVPMPQRNWAAVPPPSSTNSTAIGALVCGVLTPMTWGLTSLPAVILGHKARAEMQGRTEKGDGMATAGLVLGYLGMAFWSLFILIAVLAA
ncbi:DUF1707 and DUF4190 domain-containing protein [Streptomyces sp. XM4193]|uniref:DUF1707 and DUF4190 domain-containing protein n=1 Tax=Streptomyces sp. XM4193 TaxID=2929782 RepID=UPI001FFB058A|nr:DUF1707 and DUF4190 domain-containing protein [Streptomyces sp. XM4193]MCK1795427.1 DUF1707 and DUF4190 domain-containing protein [Streptomyces sp. XM4193]